MQFRAAILQSQAFGPVVDNEASWNILASELGCDKIDNTSSRLSCVSRASTESIRNVLERHGLGFTPVFDNVTNGPTFQDIAGRKDLARFPILIGTNADEGTVLVSVMPSPEIMLDGIFGNHTDVKRSARLAYPVNITDSELKSLITTDYTYTCTTAAIAHTAAKNGLKVWRYYFDASFSDNQPFPGAGAWHTSEIPIVFGTYTQNNASYPAKLQLSKSMQRAWADFAKNPEKGPGWRPVRVPGEQVRHFSTDEATNKHNPYIYNTDDICKYYNTALAKNSF